MDTSTPLAKVKATCCSDFRRILSVTNNDGDELTFNDSPIGKVSDSVLEESDIVLTGKSDDAGFNESASETISPACRSRIIPKELLPFLDTPNYKWTPSIITNYPTPSQDIKELSEDYFIHDADMSFEKSEISHYATNSQSHIVLFDKEEVPMNTEAAGTSGGLVSPVFLQRRSKKSNAVNKNLFPASDATPHGRDFDHSCTLIDSHSFSDVTLNALEEACCDADLFSKNSPKEASARKDISDFSLTSSFEFDDIKLPVKTTQKSFVYPCVKVKKPEKDLSVDDVIQSVLPLEHSGPITQRPKSQLVPRGLISFSELNMLTVVNEDGNCSLPVTACDEMATCTEERIVSLADEQTRPNSFPARFCRIVAKDRDIYACFKKYFEYHRVAFARSVWQASQQNTCRRAITAINYIESGQLKSADDKIAINYLSTQLQLSKVPFTLVIEFFDFFRLNFRLVYNFNIRNSVCSNFVCDTRKNRRKKRNRCRLEFEENIFVESCRSLNGNLEARCVPHPGLTNDGSQSPLRKIPRKSSQKSCATSHEDTKLDFLNESMCQEFFADFELDNDAVEIPNNKIESAARLKAIISSNSDERVARESKIVQEKRLMESTKLDDETLKLLLSEDVCVDWNCSTGNRAVNCSTTASDNLLTSRKVEFENITEDQPQLMKFSSSVGGNIKEMDTSGEKFLDVCLNRRALIPSKEVDEHVLLVENIFKSIDDDWLANEKQIKKNHEKKHSKYSSASVAAVGECLGFSTASGKAIKVDEKLLQHGKKLFDDLPSDFPFEEDAAMQVDQESKSEMLPSFSFMGLGNYPGFSTVSGKPIKVDENLLQRGKKLFDEFPLDFPLEKDTGTGKCPGFNTASGKAIKVDENLLQRGKKLFEGLEGSTVEEDINFDNLLSSSPISDLGKYPGFNTASGKAIEVDTKSLLRGKNIFNNVSSNSFQNKNRANESHQDKNAETMLSSSLLLSNKCVVSRELNEVTQLQQRTKSIDDVAAECFQEEKDEKNIKESCADMPLMSFASSSTVSEKAIDANEKLLLREEALFDDLFSNGILKENRTIHNIQSELNISSPASIVPRVEKCAAFSTASGKTINVDKESLLRARRSFDELPSDCFLEMTQLKPAADRNYVTNFCSSTSSGNDSGFRTASKKEIKVDKKLLLREKKLFEDLFSDCLPTGNKTVQVDQTTQLGIQSSSSLILGTQKSPGFSTASGKSIQIKEKSLQYGLKVLNHLPNEWPQKKMSIAVADVISRKQTAEPSIDGSCKNMSEYENQVRFNTNVGRKKQTCEQILNGPRISENVNSEWAKRKSSDASPETDENYMLIDLNSVGKISEPNDKQVNCIQQSAVPHKDSSQELFNENGVSQELQEIVTESRILHILSTTEHCETSDASVNDFTKNFLKKPLENKDEIKSGHSNNLKNMQAPSESSFPFPWNLRNALSGPLSINEIERRCGNDEKTGTLLDDSLSNPDVLQNFDPNIPIVGGNIGEEVASGTSFFRNEQDEKNSVITTASIKTEDNQEEKQELRSKNISPVFESNKTNRGRKNKKRKSQHSLSLNPLNVTYVRNDDSIASAEDTFRMLNDNFAQRSIKRKEASLNLGYPSPKKSKIVDKNYIIASRKEAEIEQQNYINNKDKNDCRQCMGSIMKQKLSGGRQQLKDVANRPQRHSYEELLRLGVKRSVINVTSQNASNFFFTKDFLHYEHSNEVGLSYGDECIVIPNEDDEVHLKELARAFLASPGVDPQLISVVWIRNHYRWIVWKLAAIEKCFPSVFGGKYLTLDNVLYQLKFRYDWEVDRCQRSALKRILEFDDSPSKTLVLCLADIKPVTVSLGKYEIELTDGWYSVFGQFDDEMSKLIANRKVIVGTKIMVMNGELVGLSEGCDPLQISNNVRFKVATNSVRRVRWDTRLGFYYGPGVRIRDLKNVLPHGGTIPQISASIARIYPVMYLEKKSDGSFIRYNEKIQFKKFSEEEKKRQTIVENLISQVTREVEKENQISNDEERQDFLEDDVDPSSYQARKYGQQEKLRYVIEERIKQRFPEDLKRTSRVSRMVKIRLINCEGGNSTSSAVLTIWQASDDLISLLSEEKSYNFHNIVALDHRNGELQLSSNRLTRYELRTSSTMPANYQRRVTIFDALKNDYKPAFEEVDVVGIVIKIEHYDSGASKLDWQTVLISDLHKNILAVSFRSNIKDFGLEDTIKPKRIIACLNLQWKRGFLRWKIPILFASDFSWFVHKSRHRHLQNCIDVIEDHFKNKCLNTFVMECEQKISQLFTNEGPVATSTPHKTDCKKNALENSFAVMEIPINTSACSNSSSELNTRNTSSKSIQSRIDRLRGYGEPPPLSPISISTRPQRARLSVLTRTFKSNSNKN